MITFIFIASSFLFIVSYGTNVIVLNGDRFDRPLYTDHPLFSIIPWISGFLLSTIPISFVIELNWFFILIINFIVAIILGPTFANFYLVRFASGKGLGIDVFQSFIFALILMIIGMVLK
jgi:hypothetical protein